MSKNDLPGNCQNKTADTRRDILKLSAAVATFGAAMGIRIDAAGALEVNKRSTQGSVKLLKLEKTRNTNTASKSQTFNKLNKLPK